MMPAWAMAQTNIERVWEQMKRGSTEEVSINKETDTDTDGKRCVYEVYEYEMKRNSSQLKSLIRAFDADCKDSYSIFRRSEGTSGDKRSVGYGKNAEKSISYGNYSDRNYYMLLFRDPKDATRRTCYEMTWYEKMSDSGYVKVFLTYIYSKDPQRLDSGVSLDDSNTTITVKPDGTIIKYDGKNNKSIVYNPASDKSSQYDDSQINDGADFVIEFNRLRTQYLKAVEFAGGNQTFFASNIMDPVNKILSLCKKHSRLLNADEKQSCLNTLADMKDRARDKGVKEMLTLATKYFR